MSFGAVEKIANAVLYEGYLLYPYRKSSVKNQKRWHFGTLDPGGGEESFMRTQVLAMGTELSSVEIRIRFLQGEEEREISLEPIPLSTSRLTRTFHFPPIDAEIGVNCDIVDTGTYRVTVGIANLTTRTEVESGPGSMLSVHTLLKIEDGEFVSLLDPPDGLRAAAEQCRNIRTWPVLAGAEGDRTMILSSPIILYDYPQIAPESAGDFFDGTEIDEILTLRVLTLTEEEKRELREGDERGRELLARTETLPPEHLARLHGAVKGLRQSSRLAFRPGDRVRLHPKKGSDIFDIVLAGRIAIVESIERDLEDRIHVAVTIEDDPGRDLGVAQQIGHRFFFSAEEMELA